MEQTVNAGTGAATTTRPTFLTVLCILTFVGTAISIIMSITGYFASSTTAALMSGAEGFEGMPGMTEAMAAVEYAGVTLAVGIVGALLCLGGALMMWKLKKTGFYVYVAGQIIPLATTAVLLGGSAFAGMALVIGGLFPVAFIIMYAINLKHMS